MRYADKRKRKVGEIVLRHSTKTTDGKEGRIYTSKEY